MRAYSMDLRLRVLAACDDGLTTAEAAEAFSVSPSWVRRLKQVRRDPGRVGPARYRRDEFPAHVRLGDRIRAAVREAPDLTLKEYVARFALPVSVPTLARALAALGLPRKKSRTGRPNRTART